MQAIVYTEYGTPDVLQQKEVEKPIPGDDEVLVKIMAASLNASDLELLKGSPYYVRIWGFLKPKYQILGSDIAGIVEAVGKNVKQFKPGDEIFGDLFTSWGGFAEYVCAPEKALMLKPPGITFGEAAAIPQAAVVALQSLRYKKNIRPGQRILINGAGGGAGSFALQIAKLWRAEVTGVDNTGKLEMMQLLGADQVIDYTREDFTQNGQRYDFIVDFVAYRSIFDYKRALHPKGVYVMVGGSLPRIFQTLMLAPWISMTARKKMGILMHKQNKEDLNFILELIEIGEIAPVIDRQYPLSEVADAFRYLGAGKAKGKIVINI